MVRSALGPTSWDSVRKLSGCAGGSLDRILDRVNQDYSSFRHGPPAKRLSGLALAEWLAQHIPERTAGDYARLLREIADGIDAAPSTKKNS